MNLFPWFILFKMLKRSHSVKRCWQKVRGPSGSQPLHLSGRNYNDHRKKRRGQKRTVETHDRPYASWCRRIVLDGHPLSKMKFSEIDKLKAKFSYVFQEGALFDAMTVWDNIALPLREKTSLPKSEIKKRVENQLQKFKLEDVHHKYTARISGGMKRRVALARALWWRIRRWSSWMNRPIEIQSFCDSICIGLSTFFNVAE